MHFFWGSFDLAVTRFSGRRAPERPGADAITREAYSHEVSSVGFWPGAGLGDPAFYSYAAPEPDGFSSAAVRPTAAHYDANLKEFIFMYDDARSAPSPSQALLDFCQSTYEAAATLAHWDRATSNASPDRQQHSTRSTPSVAHVFLADGPDADQEQQLACVIAELDQQGHEAVLTPSRENGNASAYKGTAMRDLITLITPQSGCMAA